MSLTLKPEPTAPAPAPARVLGGRFRIFQVSVLGSGLADGIYLISIPLLALSLTGSAAVVSAVGIALRAPWLLVTLPAGVLADRYPPLTLIRCASWARLPLVAALCLLAWARLLPVWGLVAGAFLIAVCGTFVDVGAQSLVPRLVDKPLLPRANANLQTGQTMVAQFAGPALGGYLAAIAGGGIGASAVLYVATLLGLGLLQRQLTRGRTEPELPAPLEQSTTARRSFRSMGREMREGAGYFRRRLDLMGLAAVAAAGNIAFAATSTMLPLWVVAPGRLGLSRTAMGFIAGAPAIGGLLAGLIAARTLRRFGGRAVLGVCAPAAGLCFAAIAIPRPAAAFGAMACYGALSVLLNVMSMSHRQSTIPAELFGRVNAVYRWIILGVSPLGALLGGVVAECYGPAAVFICAGALSLLAGTLLPVLLFRPVPPSVPPSPAPDRASDKEFA
ncbi:MFS family permease [Kitasatospora sp. MAP12-15]|uniref:MFS transporter n=1 Tax=unclassified Kitasatospora TaxID=2633591 RepID=UPI00247358B8|nr:MFS transporter [Kitasatospora sp. MAP12-44]MDH6114554.1 MFS family permease [Kitasatospora sp. MAP12-44]